MTRWLALLLLVVAACSASDAPRKCLATRDCRPGETCADATCRVAPPTACTKDADCGPMGACLEGVCAGGTACAATRDCAAGEDCDAVAGACRLAACDAAGGCPNGGFCSFATKRCGRARTCQRDDQCDAPDGLCDGGSCTAGCRKTGCPAQLACGANGRCGGGPSTCATTGCGAGERCNPTTGACETIATSCATTGCGAGERCNPTTGACETIGTGSCRNDADCGPPANVCENTACVPGCPTRACRSFETCSTGRGRCDVTTCQTDADCLPPAGKCEGGVCAAGCGTEPCVGGACDVASGRCQSGNLALDAACASNTDCQSHFCLSPPGRTAGFCTVMCGATHDCPQYRRCMEPPGIPGVRACLSPTQAQQAVGDHKAGEACTGPAECQSGLCSTVTLSCFELCARDGHCGAGEHCRGQQLAGAGLFTQLCRKDTDFVGLDQVYPAACLDTAGFNACGSLFCDSQGKSCLQPCCATADCAPDAVCLSMRPYYIGDDPATAKPVTTQLKGCLQLAHGNDPVGASCRIDSGANCRTLFCVGSRYDGSPVSASDAKAGYCSDSCCTDADCPQGLACVAADDGQGYSFSFCGKL